jgi:beta-adrenergic-receptor kinase
MADLEAVFTDISYIMAIEKARTQPPARVCRTIQLPDPSVHNIMNRYLKERGEVTFDNIFSQRIGLSLYVDFANDPDVHFKPLQFYGKILEFEKTTELAERLTLSKKIFDTYVMPDLLSRRCGYSEEAELSVRESLVKQEAPETLFNVYKTEIQRKLYAGENLFDEFLLR